MSVTEENAIDAYMVRHLSLLIDNEQDTYRKATRTAQDAAQEWADGEATDEVTAREAYERAYADRSAYEVRQHVGEAISTMIDKWIDASEDTFLTRMLREVLCLFDTSFQEAIGHQYLPEPGDLFWDEEEDDDDA